MKKLVVLSSACGVGKSTIKEVINKKKSDFSHLLVYIWKGQYSEGFYA